MAALAPIYTGWLGSEASRFPGQDTTDLLLTDFSAAGPAIKLRQHTQCLAIGVSFAYPEWRPLPGAAWVYQPGNLGFITFLDYGFDTPVVPAIGAGIQVLATMAVVNGGAAIGGYRIPWFHHLTEHSILPPGQIWYYKHSKRRGHGPAQTPTMIPGVVPKVCNAIMYGAQTQLYRCAT